MNYKAMYKNELAQAAGVTRHTLRNWMKADRAAMEEMGLDMRQKILPPCAVRYLCEKYDISIES